MKKIIRRSGVSFFFGFFGFRFITDNQTTDNYN